MRWSPLPSLKTAAQLLLLALMESAWIIALALLITTLFAGNATSLPLPAWATVLIWWVAALPVAFFVVDRPLLSLLGSLLLAAAALYVGVVAQLGEPNPLTLFSKLPSNLIVTLIIMVVTALARGLRAGTQIAAASDGLADRQLFGRFRLGMAMLVIAVIGGLVLGIGGGETLLGKQIGGQILSFLVFALVNLAWSNLEDTSIDLANRRAQNAAPHRTTWLLGGGSIVILLVIMGGLLGGVADSPIGVLFQIISSVALGSALAFSFVVGAIAGLIVPVIDFLLSAARGLAQLPDPFKPAPRNPPKNGLNLDNIFDSLNNLNAEENTRTLAFWLVAIALIILGLWLFSFFAIRRLISEPKSSRPSNTTRVRFGSWALFGQQLRDWLRALWLALLRRLGLWREPLTVGVGELGQYSGAEAQRLRDIRQIYRRFQKVAARAGVPRSPHSTPREYLSQLQANYPDLPFAATALTSTYTAARYGYRAPTPQQVEAANRALATLEGFFSGQ